MKKKSNGNLWAVHIIGPDDLIAAPSFHAAKAAVTRLNKIMLGESRRDGIICQAEVIDWPYGAESHAHSLRKDWPELL
ncbi:MAG: hypothetical protein WBA83_17090 [Burkholderiaceae bacterium]